MLSSCCATCLPGFESQLPTSTLGFVLARHLLRVLHGCSCFVLLMKAYASNTIGARWLLLHGSGNATVHAWSCKLHDLAALHLLTCRMMLSRQFHPRIGALAAVNMNRRQVDAHNPLQQPLLPHQRSAAASSTTQVSAVAGQRLLSAMDMLKPILADSPDKQPDPSLGHGMTRSAAKASKPNSQRTSETGSVSYIV